MAIHVEIEKSFKGFSLKTAFDSKSSATGILGASGSGKSMTLRCISGIEKPDKGKIIINGRTVFDSEKKINLKPQERRIGYLFQNYALFPTMTVKDNIKCGFRGEKGIQDAKVADFVKRYHLDGLENRYPIPALRRSAAASSPRKNDDRRTRGDPPRRTILRPRRLPQGHPPERHGRLPQTIPGRHDHGNT